jgi:hypothetical protein
VCRSRVPSPAGSADNSTVTSEAQRRTSSTVTEYPKTIRVPGSRFQKAERYSSFSSASPVGANTPDAASCPPTRKSSS